MLGDPVSEDGGEVMAGFAEGRDVVALNLVVRRIIRPGPVVSFFGFSQAAELACSI